MQDSSEDVAHVSVSYTNDTARTSLQKSRRALCSHHVAYAASKMRGLHTPVAGLACPLLDAVSRRWIACLAVGSSIMLVCFLVGPERVDALAILPCLTPPLVHPTPHRPITRASQPCDAATSLPLISNVFGSDMVLQQGAPVTLWGWTGQGSGGTVVIDFAGQVYASKPAAEDGKWTVTLPSSDSCSTGVDIVVTDTACHTKAVLSGVVFGEVSRGCSR